MDHAVEMPTLLRLLFAWVVDVKECREQTTVVVLGLSLLNDHDLFDSFDYVEAVDVLSEFTLLDLVVVQQVLHHIVEELSG